MKDALSIINHWIESAHKRNLTDYLVHFWIARDILEEELPVSTERREHCIEFIEKFIKPSDEKAIILEALRRAT